MGMLKEFRDFAVKGNAVDMAVGIIIGAAFGKVVTSLVNDIIMPPIVMLLSRVPVPVSSLTIPLHKEIAIKYGLFINNILDFVIVAFCIFLLVKQMNRLRPAPQAEPTTKNCPQCLSSIPVKATRCAFCTSPLEK